MTNLCVTCSHYELHPDSKDPELGLCQRIPPKISLVSGLPVQPANNFANVERLAHNPCGLDGVHHTDKTLSTFTEVPNV